MTEEKEFNLSDFRQMEQDVWSYEEEDVKEAIRLIKLNPDKINEIVGDKLI